MSRDQTRRGFLAKVAALAGGTVALTNARSGWAAERLEEMLVATNPLGLPIGAQIYPHRALFTQDPVRGFRTLADIGIERVEILSPFGYSDAHWITRYDGAQLRQILDDLGLKAESSHFTMSEFRKGVDASIAWAKEMGLKQMVIPSLAPGQITSPTMGDVRALIDEYSGYAEKMAAAGLLGVIHNERFEIAQVDGRRTYDMMIESTDPRHVKFQFQCSTAASGYDPVDYLTRYPGRFQSLHLQDLASLHPAPAPAGAPPAQGQRPPASAGGTNGNQRPIGKGVLDWRRIFTAAKIGGVQNYFIEMNLELTRESVPYLKALRA
jgi:sugar phosphate isomerase/epimerase